MKVAGVGPAGGVSFDPRHVGSGGTAATAAGADGDKGAVTSAARGGDGAWRHDATVAANGGDPARPVDAEAVHEIVDGLNRTLKAVNKRLQFLVHEMTGRVYVKVIDVETDEVIREIPPEKLLDLIGRIMEWVGLLVDEKV